jgi:RimJ/RimL family protein N-acetyltransferase
MSGTAPGPRTARLTLEPPMLGDFEDSAQLWGDAAVVRFIGGTPSTRAESWARLLRHAGHWTLLNYGYWMVREAMSGRFVGEVGFGDFRRDLTPPFGDTPEAGWVLAPWAHGRGYATEAVTAALTWADARLSAPRTVCMIDPDNVPSLRLAAKCGYAQYARAVHRGSEVVLLERARRRKR